LPTSDGRTSSPDVRSFILRALTIACAIYLSGAHWLILQGTAWTKMLVDRSQTMGFVAAAHTTFDGDHPCEMCKVVSKGTKSEQAPAGVLPKGAKLFNVPLIQPSVAVLPPPVSVPFSYLPDSVCSAPVRADAPPTPPPLA
jgi:hypothetical protein